MERTAIGDISSKKGEKIHIAGWVDVRRDHGKLIFFVLRDRSGTVQAIIKDGTGAFTEAQKLREQWVVSIQGIVNERPEKMVTDEQNGDVELLIEDLQILSEAAELPFDMDAELNLDTLLDYRPLTLRTQRSRDIFIVQATIVEAFREYLRQHGFTEYQPPAIVGGDAEGGASAFKVDYYKDKGAYLATSPQLYKQIMVGVYERVFSIGKVFRGEKHATSRHLSEYSSLDFEMGFIEDHHDIMEMTQGVHSHIAHTVAEKHPEILKRLEVEPALVPAKFPILKLKEAQEIIEKEFGGSAVGEPDLEPEHERQICEWAKKEHRSDFIFITHYPVAKRPFYTYEDEEDKGYTKSFDLLFRGLEITTGGQRVHDYDVMVQKIKDKGLNPEHFSFYLQAFKYGMPPHGGTGNGLERMTQLMLGLRNVRETTLFPRDMNRIDTRLSE
ncbi:aspartate--tRNA(Asn) ligase [bacterium]|jgi:nondiscriminating aspartyl-tRNA synthetase|nr:aspartate--tRNA(Asn) ligase [bacterium]|tara:strand:- start:1838 stop:3163 length:1326 start_codon:yes stop_codon:yes gene_type:complete